ncbi:copper amine oxidase N-terminal domain-containing protein [Schinkia azotoformans]|uniref:Copper amine oxidase-like N-terminal domain-containing protein n=1 Tax=Schinkia azotoformans LMG 9581 TaxID=1131731 RepID=K6D415_SCHAZ|nr:copper amine oxidase N-terminal domain-containing protein [Schinkia azotoformans]EKN62808.1 hypothetical protein BAZO_20363 [Schinkia azotoformans LMG 9581]MEC1639184.1 copper amine oxidase N-terminal domain-containing protein [Schinkia azotoformans]MEC1722544.1 copper amine oxidase N-terminal domain-containing protein [Schinkia azotoformans]MEC1945772.1 copper amine oxidase N-terminal domain-containing protein [Schinkia azotoformans]MED4415775.1 copper amine oxidase N-terminal domain-conta
MKNYKQFIAGVIVGGVLLSGGNVLANNASLPSITNWVKYKINGEAKALPSGYTTLNYEGHTYVPTRFIAEQLGADVEWDDQTKTVTIDKPVDNINKEVDDQENTCDKSEDPSKQDSTKYEALPVSKTINGVRVEVYSVEDDPNYTKLYVIVKNTNENLVQLDQGTASFQSELDTYANKDIRGGVLYWKDTTWFKDIGEDQDAKGYIMLPPIPKDERQGKFTVEVFENGSTQKVMNYEFDIKW